MSIVVRRPAQLGLGSAVPRLVDMARRAYSAYRSPGGQMVRRGIKRAYNSYKSNKRRRTGKVADSPVGVLSTYEQNRSRSIRSKRSSRRVIRKTKRFERAVEKVLRKDVPLFRHLIRGNTPVSYTAAAGLQEMVNAASPPSADAMSLYSCSGGVNSVDMSTVSLAVGETSTTIKKYRVPYATLEVEFKNLETVQQVNLELYYCVARRDMDTTSGGLKQDLYYGDLVTEPGSTALGPTVYGVTPFQSNKFCANWKIYKKTSHILSPGATLNITVKASTWKEWDYNEINDYVARKGITKYVVPVIWGSPSSTGFPVALASGVVWNVIKTYSVRPPLGHENESGGYY